MTGRGESDLRPRVRISTQEQRCAVEHDRRAMNRPATALRPVNGACPWAHQLIAADVAVLPAHLTPIKQSKKHALTVEQKASNAQLSAVRVRIEHCIGWVKNWRIIAERFRCAHSIYTPILRTVCGFVNLQTQRWQAAKAPSG